MLLCNMSITKQTCEMFDIQTSSTALVTLLLLETFYFNRTNEFGI